MSEIAKSIIIADGKRQILLDSAAALTESPSLRSSVLADFESWLNLGWQSSAPLSDTAKNAMAIGEPNVRLIDPTDSRHVMLLPWAVKYSIPDPATKPFVVIEIPVSLGEPALPELLATYLYLPEGANTFSRHTRPAPYRFDELHSSVWTLKRDGQLLTSPADLRRFLGEHAGGRALEAAAARQPVRTD